jgi:hypothetical protein
MRMGGKLPYLPSPVSIKNALERIRSAATPDRVTTDFVAAVLQIKGGTGAAIPPYMKRIGFVASDGAPTDLYKRFRNPAAGGRAVADAIKLGYKDLLQANEYFYKLGDRELKALIVQVTGLEADSRVATLAFSTLKALMAFADFDSSRDAVEEDAPPEKVSEGTKPIVQYPVSSSRSVGLNLAYTINLNLPATSDQAVFNAIFKSLKEHLLSSDD